MLVSSANILIETSTPGIHYRIIFTISRSVADTWVDVTFEIKQMYGFSLVFIFYFKFEKHLYIFST
jgi:hypothetical protein